MESRFLGLGVEVLENKNKEKSRGKNKNKTPGKSSTHQINVISALLSSYFI